MDERTALTMLADIVGTAGDDCAVIDDHVITIDMLHDRTDFPDGVTRYTAGWRSVGVSLSDVAAMGATAIATVAAYGAPAFDRDDLGAFVSGAREVSEYVGARYVGGDLDTHEEFTVSTAAFGQTDRPVPRSGAEMGDGVYITGSVGRTAAALDCFERGDIEQGNDLLQFPPRVHVGREVASSATAMIDSSDGLARSLHHLAEASACGFDLDGDAVPVHPALDSNDDRAWFFGEDFELVFTAPAIPDVAPDIRITEIGRVTASGVTVDGDDLPDRGYTHGDQA